jgi:hypothetical protein
LSDHLSQKIADLRQRLTGAALDAGIAALVQEHAAAERALLSSLAEKARQRRREALATLRLLHRENRVAALAGPAQRGPLRTRPRRRGRQRPKPPRHTPPKPRR